MEEKPVEAYDLNEKTNYYNLCQMVAKAREKAIIEIMYEAEYAFLKARIKSGAKPKSITEKHLFQEIRGIHKAIAKAFWWCAFTVAECKFDDQKYLERLRKRIDEANAKKYVLRSIWCFKLTKGGLPYATYLFEANQNAVDPEDRWTHDFLSPFKDVGYAQMEQCTNECVADKISYIKGQNLDKDKEPRLEDEQAWRAENGLDLFYTFAS